MIPEKLKDLVSTSNKSKNEDPKPCYLVECDAFEKILIEVEALEEKLKRFEWRPIADLNAKESDKFLVKFKDGDVHLYSKKEFEHVATTHAIFKIPINATHWMPIPKLEVK